MKNYAARKIALTDRSLQALKPAPDGARQTVWDAMMPGLAVRVSGLGKRSFYAVKRRAGDVQPTWALLGVYPIMTLGEAREAARQALTALMAGQHPKTLAEEKRKVIEAAAREAEANTFAAVANAFARQYLPRIKSRQGLRGLFEARADPRSGRPAGRCDQAPRDHSAVGDGRREVGNLDRAPDFVGVEEGSELGAWPRPAGLRVEPSERHRRQGRARQQEITRPAANGRRGRRHLAGYGGGGLPFRRGR